MTGGPAAPVARGGVRGWALWATPLRARVFLLTVEVLAGVLTVALLLTESVSTAELVRVAVIAVVAIGYGEAVRRVERLKVYLAAGGVYADQTSVWTFAGVFVAPTGWAGALAAVLYGHVLLQQRSSADKPPHRSVFTAATVILTVLATSSLTELVLGAPTSTALDGGAVQSVTLALTLALYTVLSFVLLVTGIILHRRPPTWRAVLPDGDALGYELASLVLGGVVAGVLLRTPLLTPLVLVLAVFLHRSSLVNALHRDARTDPKTGLLTLPAWTEHATRTLATTRSPITVLFCDLDHFKAINDTHGHLVGDQVLIAVSACLRHELRHPDGLGRFGGEEFVVLLTDLDPPAAHHVAQRLLTTVAALPLPCGIHVTMSIGLTHHTPSRHTTPTTLTQLLTHADTALRTAKQNGRNQVHPSSTSAAGPPHP